MHKQDFETLESEAAEAVAALGRAAYERRVAVTVKSINCLLTNVPARPGVYWIETSMPSERLQEAIGATTGKARRTRKMPPKGVKLILQEGDDAYIAYSGTEGNLQSRLAQHLFNRGNAQTIKLGCAVDLAPYSEYSWQVYYTVIDQAVLRYAVEAWWRQEVGWPVFCLR
ncbi:hypothetical protein [Ideonella oryzae]|uniref:GIY-YIG nuclease family protein n=1 Tax=Ideonella oryzae TaxID=2937441 RepID=A0ABT1BLU0_9BURK|nr:hypothetical protein [Ideonella oryzae]MCO5977196.1 hypothetical protein [Ideonella oryzae]